MVREMLGKTVTTQMIRSLKAALSGAQDADVPLSQSLNLSHTPLVTENPWIEHFVDSLQPLLEGAVAIEPPTRLVDRVYDLFDINEDGVVTKQEFVTKYLALQTGSHEQRIAALFSVFDTNGDGLVSLEEVQRVAEYVMHSLSPTLPPFDMFLQ